MDIWAWVRSTKRQLREAGDHRLAELMERLPSAVCDNEHERADAIFPEALALARKAANPWAEVFVRHWNLQSRILHRHEVGDWTGEAVSLIEFANRPETRSCPQSICVTQDLVNCYGNVDGPGFAEERLQATAETLDRIDPKWPCFVCISSERADALLDAGLFEEALAFIDAQTQALVKANAPRARDALGEDRASALLALGRAAEALEVLDALGRPMDKNDATERAIGRARVLLRMERFDEALEVLPGYDQIEPTPGLYAEWCEVVVGLADAGKIVNDWQLDARLELITARLLTQGVRRDAIDLLFARGRLALDRDAPHVAEELADRAEALFPELHRVLDARGEAVALRGRINVAEREVVVPAANERTVVDLLSADPELNLPLLEDARQRWPASLTIAQHYARALNVRGRHLQARAFLEEFAAQHPSAELTGTLGQTLLDAGDHTALRHLCTETLAHDPGPDLAAQCHWLLARSYKESQPATCRTHLEAVVALKPEATNCQTWLAELERDAGDWRQALDRLNGVCAREPDAGSYDWDRLTVATLLADWPAARDSARRIGYVLPEDEEGPIVLPGILCRIRFQDAEGGEQTLYARRTGPVTADVVQMRPEPPCRYRDEIIFDAAPLNGGPKEGEHNHTWIYRAVHTLKQGGYSVHPIDGVHPGEAALVALRAELETLGCETQVFSGESYRLNDPESDDELPGLYLMLAVPDTVNLTALDAELIRLTAAYPHPLTWPSLAQAVGLPERIEAHRAAAALYGM